MQPSLIVETDIGRDPDDFFAICYLIAVGIPIKAITVSPGDRDQIAVAKFLCHELSPGTLVGSGDLSRSKKSTGGVHIQILKKYGAPLEQNADGDGAEIIQRIMSQYPDTEVLTIGPLTSLGRYLTNPQAAVPRKVTMQGGFVGYGIHNQPVKRLAKFEGKQSVGTFNLNGDIRGAAALLGRTDIERMFVGKNVCHTIEYDRERHKSVLAVPCRNRAMELFREGMGMYLEKHPVKLFHDPAAAVCMLHPEIGIWIEGTLYRDRDGWGTRLGGPDKMLIDIDYDKLWQHIAEGS